MKRSMEELRVEFFGKIFLIKEQAKRLRGTEERDTVFHSEVCSMATTIRSICYNKPGNPSLLVSSGLEEKMVFGFRMDYSAFAANMAGWNKLCEMELSPNHFYVKALPLELPFRLFFDFYCWWHEIVVSLPNSGNEILITREEIIRTVADKFGAHTDPETDDKKDEVEGEAIGWRFFSSTGYSGFPMNSLYEECVLTIGEELVEAAERIKGGSTVFSEPTGVHVIPFIERRKNTGKCMDGVLLHFFNDGSLGDAFMNGILDVKISPNGEWSYVPLFTVAFLHVGEIKPSFFPFVASKRAKDGGVAKTSHCFVYYERKGNGFTILRGSRFDKLPSGIDVSLLKRAVNTYTQAIYYFAENDFFSGLVPTIN